MEYFLKGVSRLKMRLKTVSNLQISLQIPDTLEEQLKIDNKVFTFVVAFLMGLHEPPGF